MKSLAIWSSLEEISEEKGLGWNFTIRRFPLDYYRPYTGRFIIPDGKKCYLDQIAITLDRDTETYLHILNRTIDQLMFVLTLGKTTITPLSKLVYLGKEKEEIVVDISTTPYMTWMSGSIGGIYIEI